MSKETIYRVNQVKKWTEEVQARHDRLAEAGVGFKYRRARLQMIPMEIAGDILAAWENGKIGDKTATARMAVAAVMLINRAIFEHEMKEKQIIEAMGVSKDLLRSIVEAGTYVMYGGPENEPCPKYLDYNLWSDVVLHKRRELTKGKTAFYIDSNPEQLARYIIGLAKAVIDDNEVDDAVQLDDEG